MKQANHKKDKKIKLFTLWIVIALLIVLVGSTIDVTAKAPKNTKDYKNIEDKIDKEGSANVIITIRDTHYYDKADTDKSYNAGRTMKSSTTSLVDNSGFKTKKELSIIQGYAGTIDKRTLNRLRQMTENAGLELMVYEDRPLHILAEPSLSTTLDNSVESIGGNYSRDILNITGRNITVAVIDTGIDYTHPDLGGCFNDSENTTCRIIGGYDFRNDDPDPMDDNGHGTHVAGIVGANGSIMGVAPDVKFYALKVCEETGTNCSQSNIIAAIEWAVENNASIITMSLGVSYSSSNLSNAGMDLISDAVNVAIDSGVVVVAAAGNDGPGIGTTAIPGASEEVITVGGVDDRNTLTQNDDLWWSGGSTGPSSFGRLDPDILAPGVNIRSTVPDGSCVLCDASGYKILSGTSMATPHVTGVVALMLENNPTLTPKEVRNTIMGTAINITGKVFEKGTGEINIQRIFNNNLNVTITGRNTYGQYSVDNDRWEFISPINGTEYANISIMNNYNFDINFSIYVTSFENMENNRTLNNSQLHIIQNFTLNNGASTLLEINFSLDNFTQEYAATYGGLIILNGINSTGYDINWSIPVVITIPIKNYALFNRTFFNSGAQEGDVLTYAYYNEKSGNETFIVTCDDLLSNDFDLYIYDSLGGIDDFAGYWWTDNEVVTSTINDTIRWVRIHGYGFSPEPYNITLNITDNGNNPPEIINITDIDNNTNLNFSTTENITIKINYSDADNDPLTIDFNDSRYSIIASGSDYITYYLETNSSMVGKHRVEFTLMDDYGAVATANILVSVTDVTIDSYTPNNFTIIVNKGAIINFTQSSSDTENRTLYYYWYVNNVLNSSDSQNFNINTSALSGSYNITFVVSNNNSNTSISWNLTIDDAGPTISINDPESTTYYFSEVELNYSVSDISNVSKCWYSLNDGITNITLSNCVNITLHLASDDYSLTVYANDTYNNINSDSVNFVVDDTDEPLILNIGPDGSFSSSTTSVTLTVTTDEYATCRYGEEDYNYTDMDDFDETGTTEHTSRYSVDSGYEYTLYVKCRDLSGNTNAESELIIFIVKLRTSSGGGSSSGGSSYVPPTTPTVSNSYSNFIIEAKGKINLTINNNNIAITKIDAAIVGTKNGISMKVEQFDVAAKPEASTIPAHLRKYALLSITHTNLLNDDVASVSIKLKVSKKWLSENNVDRDKVLLYRYTGVWEWIPTHYLSEDSEYYYYLSVSPGMSLFMITGEAIDNINSGTDQNAQLLEEQLLAEQEYYASLEKNQSTDANSLDRKPETQDTLSIFDDNITENNAIGTNMNLKSLNFMLGAIILVIIAIGVTIQKITNKKSKDKELAIERLGEQYNIEGRQIIQRYTKMARNIKPQDPKAAAKMQYLKMEYAREIQTMHDKYQMEINKLRK